jgi:hypothetical protein
MVVFFGTLFYDAFSVTVRQVNDDDDDDDNEQIRTNIHA